MNLEILFMEKAVAPLLRFIESTEVGKKLSNEMNKYDWWDVARLEQRDDEDATENVDRGFE